MKDEQVWMKLFCALLSNFDHSANTHWVCDVDIRIAANNADYALSEFRERYPEEAPEKDSDSFDATITDFKLQKNGAVALTTKKNDGSEHTEQYRISESSEKQSQRLSEK